MKRCTLCYAANKHAVEELLLRNTPLRKIAEQTGISPWVIHRHKKHWPQAAPAAQETRAAAQSSALVSRIEELIAYCRGVAANASKDRNWSGVTSALREIRGNFELLARLSGELQYGVRIGIHNTMVNVNAETSSEVDVELAIAREVAEATNGFDPREIGRLKALLDAPLMLEGTLGNQPDASPESVS
jgi:hypothetical protein